MQQFQKEIDPKYYKSNDGAIAIEPVGVRVLKEEEIHIGEAEDLDKGDPKNMGLYGVGSAVGKVLLGVEDIDSGLFILECIF